MLCKDVSGWVSSGRGPAAQWSVPGARCDSISSVISHPVSTSSSTGNISVQCAVLYFHARIINVHVVLCFNNGSIITVRDQTVMILRTHLTVDLTRRQEKSWLAAHRTGIASLLILVLVVCFPVVGMKKSGLQHMLLS